MSSKVRVVVMRRHIEENSTGVDLKPVLRVYREDAVNEDDHILVFGIQFAESEVKYSYDKPLFGKFHVWMEGIPVGTQHATS